MSLHYEVVFACSLRDDAPEDVLNALRWHLGLIANRPASLDGEAHSCPLLAPDPDSHLPGGDVASLRRQLRGSSATGDIYAWGLFTRNYWLDDELGEIPTILKLLAPHVAEDGYGGYYREVYDQTPVTFMFHDGAYAVLRYPLPPSGA